MTNAGDSTGCMLQALQTLYHVWMSFQLNHDLFPPEHQKGRNLQKGEGKESQKSGEQGAMTRWIFPRTCPAGDLLQPPSLPPLCPWLENHSDQ